MTNWNRIVVGVDGSKESRAALEWACELADQRGAEVVAVTTWTVPPQPTDPPYGSFPWGNSVDFTESSRQLLAEAVADVATAHSKVKISQHVAAGNAAAVLIEFSKEADLVVVGAKGHGGFTGMLIGSVSQHVLAHSACTVVVVR
jgi:nucleotide-binding universal stress UspA family protein